MKTGAITREQRKEGLKRNEEKWTPTLMAAGWTAMPCIILERQLALGLDPIDVNSLLHLAKHWWYSDRLVDDARFAARLRAQFDALERSKYITSVSGLI